MILTFFFSSGRLPEKNTSFDPKRKNKKKRKQREQWPPPEPKGNAE